MLLQDRRNLLLVVHIYSRLVVYDRKIVFTIIDFETANMQTIPYDRVLPVLTTAKTSGTSRLFFSNGHIVMIVLPETLFSGFFADEKSLTNF